MERNVATDHSSRMNDFIITMCNSDSSIRIVNQMNIEKAVVEVNERNIVQK